MNHRTTLKVSCAAPIDPDATPIAPVLIEHEAEGDRPTASVPPPADEEVFPRYDTPLLPAALPVRTELRATLTVLTGLQAGRIVAVDGVPMTIGRGAEADLVVQDTGVSRLHVRIARTAEGAFYAEDLGSKNGTFRGQDRIGLTLLCAGDLLQLGPYLQVRFAVVDSVEESLYRQLYESSVHDPLTHVFNRQYLSNRLFAEIAHAQRSGGEVAILMIDVDCLKDVNDHFGHLAGDRALCTIAARILRVLRVEDMLARYGGDEFVVVAAGADAVDARQLAERVRHAVDGLHMSAQGRDVHVTASIGLASLAELAESDDPVAALLALADARMYGAKVSGRNRVCMVTPAPAHPAD
jgi:two-component system, cell cycle response regulator